MLARRRDLRCLLNDDEHAFGNWRGFEAATELSDREGARLKWPVPSRREHSEQHIRLPLLAMSSSQRPMLVLAPSVSTTKCVFAVSRILTSVINGVLKSYHDDHDHDYVRAHPVTCSPRPVVS